MCQNTNSLSSYIEIIVEPTLEDFSRNPQSVRHAFLACVAIYHAVDRFSYPKKPGNLGRQWGRECFEFRIVDMIAHHFKHVKSDFEKEPAPENAIHLPLLIFGEQPDNEELIGLHNLFFVIRDAVKFLKNKISTTR